MLSLHPSEEFVLYSIIAPYLIPHRLYVPDPCLKGVAKSILGYGVLDTRILNRYLLAPQFQCLYLLWCHFVPPLMSLSPKGFTHGWTPSQCSC
jgi:hypothetical protein